MGKKSFLGEWRDRFLHEPEFRMQWQRQELHQREIDLRDDDRGHDDSVSRTREMMESGLRQAVREITLRTNSLSQTKEGVLAHSSGPRAKDSRTDREKRGEHCAKVLGEMKKIKSECTTRGKTVAEMERDYPDLAVWAVVRNLPAEDQELFRHPRRWGASAGYAHDRLATFYDKSPATIKDWIKLYRRMNR